MNNKNIILLVVGVLIIVVGFYFFKNQNSSSEKSVTATTTVAPQPKADQPPAAITHKIDIANFAFNKSSITIKKGDTVIWTNKDSVSHTVSGDNGGPNSAFLNQNQTYSFTFDNTGSFSYHCKPHPSMTGTVIVTN